MTRVLLCCYDSFDNVTDKFRVKRTRYYSSHDQFHLGSALWGWIRYPRICTPEINIHMFPDKISRKLLNTGVLQVFLTVTLNCLTVIENALLNKLSLKTPPKRDYHFNTSDSDLKDIINPYSVLEITFTNY